MYSRERDSTATYMVAEWFLWVIIFGARIPRVIRIAVQVQVRDADVVRRAGAFTCIFDA